jgi:cellulose synthase/poly-beta-1,6-N-acetylglucosamine synthase-like glycosyltransferase
MVWYYYVGSLIMLLQLSFVLLVYRNRRYAINKYERDRSWYQPKTALIVPCKGLDLGFERNIGSLFKQEYDNYLLWFVVEAEDDPAYKALLELKEGLGQSSKAIEIKIWISGKGTTCSQKIHNLLYCCERVPEDVGVLAFADSDIEVRRDWLSHLVYPLRQEKNGVASGYRWFVPEKNNLATLALSAGNAKVAQLLGNSIFNEAWGGSMAVRVKTFRELEMDKIWPHALSDDLSLSETVKKAGLKVAFVPACLAASYEVTNWSNAFEFVRRQFLITKVFSPGTWWFSITAMSGSVLTTWGSVAIAVYAGLIGATHFWFFVLVPIVSLLSQLLRAIIRQMTIGSLLKDDSAKLKLAMLADILFFWLWSIMLWTLIVSTVFGRTIRWRGIRYKMLSSAETIVLRD